MPADLKRGGCLAQRPGLVGRGTLGPARVVAVAGEGEHPPHTKTRTSGRDRQFAGSLRDDPSAVVAAVDLDQHLDIAPP